MSTIAITTHAPTWAFYVISALLCLNIGLNVWIAHLNLKVCREMSRWSKV
jgi:hypothetical protein